MKDSVTRGRGFRPRGTGFVRVTSGHPCPVCGRDKFCSIGDAGVLCTQVEEGSTSAHENNLGRFWFHPFDAVRVKRPEKMPPPAPSIDRAPVEVRDRAYRALLAQLSLDTLDREGLRARGLTDAQIAANGYRSLRVQGRARLALAVVDAVGEELARTIPGVYWHEEGKRAWWSLAGSPGILVPTRDLDGRIVAVKVRRRDPCEGPRYTWVTSSTHGGPSSENATHVPELARELRGSSARLVVTEGELKADVSTALARVPVVSVPGVEAWRVGMDLLRAWGVRLVDVCFDMDRLANPKVADAAAAFVKALRMEGFDAGTLRWDVRFKGLDDFLVARARSRGEV